MNLLKFSILGLQIYARAEICDITQTFVIPQNERSLLTLEMSNQVSKEFNYTKELDFNSKEVTFKVGSAIIVNPPLPPTLFDSRLSILANKGQAGWSAKFVREVSGRCVEASPFEIGPFNVTVQAVELR